MKVPSMVPFCSESSWSAGETATTVPPSAVRNAPIVGEDGRTRRPLKSSVARTGFLVVLMLPGWWVSSSSTLTPLCSGSRYFARRPASLMTLVPISELLTPEGRCVSSVSGKRPGAGGAAGDCRRGGIPCKSHDLLLREVARRLYVTVRVLRLPAPGVAAHLLEAARRAPPQLLRGERGIGPVFREIAGAARGELDRNGPARCGFERLHHFEHRVAASGAEVDGDRAVRALEEAQRRDVRLGEVHHVQVIAHPGAVRRVVVLAEDPQGGSLPACDLRDIRQEVLRDAART